MERGKGGPAATLGKVDYPPIIQIANHVLARVLALTHLDCKGKPGKKPRGEFCKQNARQAVKLKVKATIRYKTDHGR